jgi:Icc-related predicted phosphoesterase
MRIWLISDTHTQHAGLAVPQAEMVIHCGDEANSADVAENAQQCRDFFEWFTELPIPQKLFVPGNHSTAIEQGAVSPADYPSVRFLLHESFHFDGLRIFGSPYTPQHHDWVFMRPRSSMNDVWQTVPSGVDLLITHGPPKGILDLTYDGEAKAIVQGGCSALRSHVDTRIQPKVHAFGHFHDQHGLTNFGTYTRGQTKFINCSCCDRAGSLVNPGCVIELHPSDEANDQA